MNQAILLSYYNRIRTTYLSVPKEKKCSFSLELLHVACFVLSYC